jgi:hypothetical protein
VLALLDGCVECDQRLAGRDADVDLQVPGGGELLTDRQRGPDGALGIVLVRDGAPKIAITASPTNFATVPPCRSRTERRWAWYGCRSRCTSSGSIRSARAVNPTWRTHSFTFRPQGRLATGRS